MQERLGASPCELGGHKAIGPMHDFSLAPDYCRRTQESSVLEDSCEDPSENRLNIPVRQQSKGPRRRFPHGMLRFSKSTAFRGGPWGCSTNQSSPLKERGKCAKKIVFEMFSYCGL